MKKHRVNRIMTFILVLALSVSTLLTGCGKNNDKIVLGWIGPLTGEMTIWGTAEMQALTMAVEDTNAAGGLLGKEVELKTYDNRGDAVETTNAAKKAIQQDGCIALFGCNTSACAIALSEVCAQFNTAKAGAIGFTTSLAKEMAPYNVNVNVIPVPTTDTPLLRATLSQEMIQREIDVTPMKRIATTEDIADTVLFLVSDAARYITGQIIAPNGGRRMLV